MNIRQVLVRCGANYSFAGYAKNRVGAAACINNEIYFSRMLVGVRAKDIEITGAPCRACGQSTSAFIFRIKKRQ